MPRFFILTLLSWNRIKFNYFIFFKFKLRFSFTLFKLDQLKNNYISLSIVHIITKDRFLLFFLFGLNLFPPIKSFSSQHIYTEDHIFFLRCDTHSSFLSIYFYGICTWSFPQLFEMEAGKGAHGSCILGISTLHCMEYQVWSIRSSFSDTSSSYNCIS